MIRLRLADFCPVGLKREFALGGPLGGVYLPSEPTAYASARIVRADDHRRRGAERAAKRYVHPSANLRELAKITGTSGYRVASAAAPRSRLSSRRAGGSPSRSPWRQPSRRRRRLVVMSDYWSGRGRVSGDQRTHDTAGGVTEADRVPAGEVVTSSRQHVCLAEWSGQFPRTASITAFTRQVANPTARRQTTD